MNANEPPAAEATFDLSEVAYVLEAESGDWAPKWLKLLKPARRQVISRARISRKPQDAEDNEND